MQVHVLTDSMKKQTIEAAVNMRYEDRPRIISEPRHQIILMILQHALKEINKCSLGPNAMALSTVAKSTL